jgi:hypothetical protein
MYFSQGNLCSHKPTLKNIAIFTDKTHPFYFAPTITHITLVPLAKAPFIFEDKCCVLQGGIETKGKMSYILIILIFHFRSKEFKISSMILPLTYLYLNPAASLHQGSFCPRHGFFSVSFLWY